MTDETTRPMRAFCTATAAFLALGLGCGHAPAVGRATDELSGAGRRARHLDDALIPVRVETRRARASIERLRRK